VSTQYSIAQTKDNLTRLLRIVETGDHVHITRRGRPVAVLMSVQEYRCFQQQRPSFLDALRQFNDHIEGDDAFIDDDFLSGLRDRVIGREVDL
jgi:antitoxin Phd